MPNIDKKANEVFGGRVVRKDLVRQVKAGALVPVFVLEYLLGKYCATDNPVAIEVGVVLLNSTLVDSFASPNEATKMQSLVRERGKHTLIDKVKVRYLSADDKYWAELVGFGHRYVHIPERYIREYDRLLTGGIWAQMEIVHQYDETAKGTRSPFYIADLRPIQIANFDLDEYCRGRGQFTDDEWIDLLVRSIGLEPTGMTRRLKLQYLVRLIPLCEGNYNLIELGPRATGKSYAYQQLSPYTILLTGPTTVANLFYNMATNRIGLVGLWDAVGFDEVADLEKMPKEVVTTLKTYCESGTFARGREVLTGGASVAMFGNTDQPVEVMVQSSHLFVPMPEVIREDMAFLDRLHYYLPGWEIPKVQTADLTEHYGFIVDYLAAACHELRRQNFVEQFDRYFSFGAHLNARDERAVRKTLAGLIKLIYPHEVPSREAMAELVGLAMEGRRRVKEQLKKMGSFEYYRTSFSYIDRETREEWYVGVPEEGGRSLISTDPLSPGSVYTASVDEQGRASLYRLEVGCSSGTGKMRIGGGTNSAMRDSIQRAFAYLQGHKVEMGIGQAFDTTDYYVEAIDLLTNNVASEAGTALVVAINSALRKTPVLPGLLVLGDLTIQGNLRPVRSLSEPLQMAMDNGARKALIPIENKRNFLDVSADIMERVDPVFYGDPVTAATKALGIA
ncbi:MAG: protease Lon-related BREX system protein BrxL [Anaerolineales bacterium]|nr:protease Lon-related BREX system protein BrxL [Anaerolineales bacterium]